MNPFTKKFHEDKVEAAAENLEAELFAMREKFRVLAAMLDRRLGNAERSTEKDLIAAQEVESELVALPFNWSPRIGRAASKVREAVAAQSAAGHADKRAREE